MERHDAAGDKPWITDFGIAVTLQELGFDDSKTGGTPLYRSPEQARGESHRVAPASDVYSVGVMLYEMLVGPERAGVTLKQNKDRRRARWPLDDSVPEPLKIICHRALEFHEKDRYKWASDMAAHLDRFLDEPAPVTVPMEDDRAFTIRPPGLRSFGRGDGDFYPRLLEPPCDYDGLPESISLWRRRLAATGAEESFAVGLIYGPSGCGKSSLVKAGLLPRLPDGIKDVFIEATSDIRSPGDTTEQRLLSEIREVFKDMPADLSLVGAVTWLREAEQDTLIVLDQFEQWLSVHNDVVESELFLALRQCDARHVRCLLLVRDEYAAKAGRFLDEVRERPHEDRKTATVELMSADHAREVVLPALGRAYNRFQGDLDSPDARPHKQFIERAVAMLAESDEVSGVNNVMCIKLALFAEMMKKVPWVPGTLKPGQTFRDIGRMFLESNFNETTAPENHRDHVKAARRVLEGLVPEVGGQRMKKSVSELVDVSGYRDRPEEFQKLRRILDHDLHLITVVHSAGCEASADDQYYQLTHDFLEQPLRDWLEAGLSSAERELRRCTQEWRASNRDNIARRERRYLPGPVAYPNILFRLRRKLRTDDELALMRAAHRFYGFWGSMVGAVLLAVLMVGLLLWNVSQVQQAAAWNRAQNEKAAGLVDSLIQAPAQAVELALKNLAPLQNRAITRLNFYFRGTDFETWQKLHAAYALAEIEGEHQQDAFDFVMDQIPAGAADECRNIVRTLSVRKTWALEQIDARFTDADLDTKVRYATVALHLGDKAQAQSMLTGPAPDELKKHGYPGNRTAFIHGYPLWYGDLVQLKPIFKDDGTVDDPNDKQIRADLRSGLCAALGLVTNERDIREVKDLVEQIYQDVDAAGTHGAATFALTKWKDAGLAKPDSVITQPLTRSYTTGCDWFVNDVGMTMLRVPAGRFTMGSEDGNSDEKPHEVTLTQAFYLADREVTVALYKQFVAWTIAEAKGNDVDLTYDEKVGPADDCPIQSVSWLDAVKFCNWLSGREGLPTCYRRTRKKVKAGLVSEETDEWLFDPTIGGYRLPTEAQWEYACRAGSQKKYCYGDDEARLDIYAVMFPSGGTRPAGMRLPNRWGLFDMHGNVWEWCNDWYGVYPESSQKDPLGPKLASYRVNRGGSWHLTAEFCRSAIRLRGLPDSRVS